MKRLNNVLLAAAIASCFASETVYADKSPTVGDVLKRAVDVRVGEKVTADPERARLNYEAFLALSNADDALRADALRRLGDLKLEAGEEERIGRDLASGLPLATQDAIKLYSKLLETAPNYNRTDAVLYQLARAYEAAGDTSGSLQTLEALVKRFPESPMAAESYFRRGEIFFTTHRWLDAESAYQQMLSNFPRSEFVEQATYKLGWSRFKSGDTDGALDAFVHLLDRQLIDASGRESDLEAFPRPRRELVEDTLRVTSIIFSSDDGATGVDKFLSRVGTKPYADQLYATLGDLYSAKERWTDAATAYSAFEKREPMNERAPLLHSVAIDAYRRGGFAQLVLASKQDYVERYGLSAPFWAHRRVSDLPLVVRELKQNLQDLAAYYHGLAQSSKTQEDYRQAARWYREFLTEFPNDQAAGETTYLLADSLFESHQYGEASEEYQRVAYEQPTFQRSSVAGYASVVALEKEELAASGVQREALHQKVLEASVRFAKAFPTHLESGSVLVRVARQRLEGREFSLALDTARDALARQADLAAPLIKDAWIVTAASEFELAHYDRSEKAGLEVLKLLANDDPQRKAIEERVAASIYRQAEAQRDAGAMTDAANTFLRVGQLVPRVAIHETADFDAAAAFLAAERWSDAIDVLERYRKDYPKSDRQAEVTRRLAVAYLASNQGTTAAREFERIAQQPTADSATQREALSQAADLYEKAGETARAVAAWELYLKRFPESFEIGIEARQKLADFALAARDASRRATLLDELIKADAAGATHRTDRSRYLAAQASLELASVQRDSFASIRLSLPLKRTLEAKRTALQKALQAYERADRYAVADVSTSATYEMAELYRRLAVDLMKSDRPKTLSGDALEQYDLLLEEQSFPFEEKAIGLHELNVARVNSGTYDHAVRQSFEALAVLKPARYAKAEAGEELTIDLRAGSEGEAPLDVNVRFQEAVARTTADPKLAEQEFLAISKAWPKLAGPLLNSAVIAVRDGRYSDAEPLLAEAVKIAPRNAAILDEIGVVARNLGQFSDAERAYRAALVLDPDSVRLHRNFGVLLDLYLGRAEEAVAQWRLAIDLQGGDKVLEGWVAEVSHRSPASPIPSGGQ